MIWFSLVAVFLIVAAVTTLLVIRRRRASTSVRRGSVTKRVLASIAGVAAGIVIAVSGAGATYAYLNAQATTGATTLRAGTLGLTVSAVDSAAFTAMLPGESVQRDVTVTSTGDAAAVVTVTRTAPGALVVSIAATTCAAVTGLTTWTAVSTTSASLGDFGKGQARAFCLRVAAPTVGLAESAAVGFTLDFSSVQKAL